MSQKHKLKLINVKNIYSLWAVCTFFLMAPRHFTLWPDYLNCSVLLLFPDGIPLMCMRGVHKQAMRNHQSTRHSSMHKLGDIFTTGQGRRSCSKWGRHWYFLCASLTICLKVARLFFKDCSCAVLYTVAAHRGSSWETKRDICTPTVIQNSLQRGQIAQNPEVTGRNRCARHVCTYHRTDEKSLRKKATIEGHWDEDTTVLPTRHLSRSKADGVCKTLVQTGLC